MSPRVRFLLLDVVELRERQWVPRPRQVTELKTIDQVWVWLVGGCSTHHLRVSELISKFVHNYFGANMNSFNWKCLSA